MVIGNGMLAKVFEATYAKSNTVIFASGVSYSKINDAAAFEREITLLQKTMWQYGNSLLVYFSTCSIYDDAENQSPYVLHKLNIENIIKKNQPNYIILRVSNLVGNTTNPHTIINFLAHKINNNLHFTLWEKAYRNLIDIDDMYKITDYIINANNYLNQTINIANPSSYSVKYIVQSLETFFNKNANYTTIDIGQEFEINTNKMAEILNEVGINFEENYLNNVLKKYF